MNEESRDYFERRANEEAALAEASANHDTAAVHRSLERHYRARLANDDTGRLAVVEDV